MHKECKTTRLEQALYRWQDWPLPLTDPPKIKGAPLAGRTNQNLRLAAPELEHDLVLRLHHPESASLGIDRELEKIAIQAAAETGITRPALHWDDELDYSVFRYIAARTWTSGDFIHPDQRRRLWPVLDRLAQIKLPIPKRSYTDYLNHYWVVLESHNAVDANLRNRWAKFQDKVAEFDAADWPVGLVHHDLIPANVLDTGQQLILIDWEYAAMSHPDIDRWSLDPASAKEPFISHLMDWINRLWERIVIAE